LIHNIISIQRQGTVELVAGAGIGLQTQQSIVQ